VGVLLAIASYLALHPLAVQDLPPIGGKTGTVGELAVKGLIRAGATYFQYILPLFCLAGAAASALARRKRRQLVADVAQSESADALNSMNWQSFEQLVGEAFRLKGYSVTETGGGGADGGVDLTLTREGEKFLVQCKQWKAFKVGVEVVRELYGLMAATGATGGFVVTSGRFTQPAIDFAAGRNIELVDGPRLKAMIEQAQLNGARGGLARPVFSPRTTPAHAVASTEALISPECPKCTKSMVKRITKRGSRPGLEFWGCSGYPNCRGILPIAQNG